MLAMLAVSVALVTNTVPVAEMTPRERMEWRLQRSREMRKALHLDEASWEARRYEIRKRRCNQIGDEVRKFLNYPTNAVSFSIDFRTGDIRVEFEGGGAYVQRYVPGKEPVSVRPGKPRRKENPKFILKPDGTLWNPPFRTRPKKKEGN